MRPIWVARRVLYDLVIPLAIGFVLVSAGTYFVLQSVPLVQGAIMMTPFGQQVEVVTDHQIFKDVLLSVLAIATIGLAAFGYGAYKILSSQIEESVRKRIEARYQMSQAHGRTSLGLMNWMLYKNSGQNPDKANDKAEAYLEEAIRYTRIAYTLHAIELDKNDHRVERLICDIRNNWAYYASEKHCKFGGISASEQGQFLRFADWIEERINDHPENATDYQDTIDVVRRRFKNSDADATTSPKNKA